MSTKVIGRLESWDAGDVEEKSTFIKLEEGSNILRCVTSPFQFYSHWTTDASGKQTKVKCCLKDCPVCARGEDPQARWYVACLVLDEKNSKVGILEIGTQIFKGIKSLTTLKNSKGVVVWGDPRGYAINITRHPKGANPLYTVTPQPKEPLTDEEKNLIKSAMETIDLQKMSAAPTPQEISKKLGLEVPKKELSKSKVSELEETETTEEESEKDQFDFDNL